MNAELLYTSAPQGLKQGSRGFCTVLSTVGMPLNLATKLESLSGYRHMYPSGTPDASKNPVGFSHLRFTVGGRQISVLSRISDYGLDYSQRTNKLAHHIVVDAPMPACGPAALLAEPGVMRDHWDGQCANIPSPPALPDLSTEPQICRKWEAITGDAGWGGVVANAWLSTSPRPVFIIFAEHQSDELLGLIKESIALIPPNKRWQATFGTYVTTLPPDVDCRVRCVVAGSDEARMASARGTVIDLTTQISAPSVNGAVCSARNGQLVGPEATCTTIPTESNEITRQSIPAIIGKKQEHNNGGEMDFDPEHPFEASEIGIPPAVKKNKSNEARDLNITEYNAINRSKIVFVLIGVASTLLITIATVLFIRNEIKNFQDFVGDSASQLQVDEDGDEKFHPPAKKTEKAAPQNQQSVDALPDPAKPGMVSAIPLTQSATIIDSQKNNPPEASQKDGDGDKPEAKRKLEAGKIIIQTGLSFTLENTGVPDRRLPILGGIPGSSIDARLDYQTDDSGEKAAFQKTIEGTKRIEWSWEFQQNENQNWEKAEQGNTPKLQITTKDPPNAKIRVTVLIEGMSNHFGNEPIRITKELTHRTTGYASVELNLNEYLKERDGSLLKPKLPAISTDGYQVFCLDTSNDGSTKRNRTDDYTVGRLKYSDREKKELEEFVQNCDELIDNLKEVNDLRSDLWDGFSKSFADFHKECNGFPTPVFETYNRYGILFSGRQTLREKSNNEFRNLTLKSTWSISDFALWYKTNSAIDLLDEKDIKNPSDQLRNIEIRIFKSQWCSDGKTEGLYYKKLKSFLDIAPKYANRLNSLKSERFSMRPLSIGFFASEAIRDKPEGNSLASRPKAVFDAKIWTKAQIIFD